MGKNDVSQSGGSESHNHVSRTYFLLLRENKPKLINKILKNYETVLHKIKNI